MKIIGIIPNRDKDESLKYTKILVNSIIKRGGSVKLASDVAKDLFIEDDGLDEDAIFDNCEMVICLGGDGTFLKAARRAYPKGLPILGINLGNLGFLTEVDKSKIENAVEKVMNGTYCIEERMMLESIIYKDGKIIAVDHALNDVVVSRGAVPRILHINTYVNDGLVDSFPGDGLVISSPTGSTAYTLSAGGPIVEPDIDLIVITPICPHILYSRSYIASGNRIVKVVITDDFYHNATVTVDGQAYYEIRGGDMIEVRKSPYSVKMVRLSTKNFFKIFRTKIYDRGESLRQDEV